MTLAKAKAKTNETFIVHVSLTIVIYDRKNMFIVQATVETAFSHLRDRYLDQGFTAPIENKQNGKDKWK
jgi:hypothetical protein